MKPLPDHCGRNARGFSLLEIVLVLFVLGALAAVLTPSVREIIERSRREIEVRALDDLAATVAASFENTDLTNLNVAALPGSIAATDAPTVFSASTTATYTTTENGAWFAKVARLRGLSPQVGAAPGAQAELARLAFNGSGNSRLMFAGPDEAGRQRFLLISLVARSDQLALPAYESTAAWFDAIWNHEWESRTATLPAFWQSRLSAAQIAAWHAGSGGLTQVNRVVVRRIVLPKFRVTVNSNHPTEQAFVSFNNTPNAFTAPANSGAASTPEILGGRLITINRGTAWPGVEALRFRLRENATVTVQ
ncbi:MAG: prepilin-type N-terminal cleavage/methylation domain-containing protein [Acidobacteria bacterium]|nr:prepilin-type N-terminal cleavage/methylation domain-containing protein [Acidobacteriota bacterium]